MRARRQASISYTRDPRGPITAIGREEARVWAVARRWERTPWRGSWAEAGDRQG